MDKEPQESSNTASFFAKRHQRFVISDKSLACDEIGCTWRGCPHHDHFWNPEVTSRQGVVSYRRLVEESRSEGGLGGGSSRGCACCQMLREIVDSVCHCRLRNFKSREGRRPVHACIEVWIWTYGGNGREFDLQARWVCGGGSLDFRRQRGVLSAGSPLGLMKMGSPYSSSFSLTPEPGGQKDFEDLCSNVDLPRCRSWLDECNRTHNGCVRHETPPPLPSRLLFATEGKVELRETGKFPTLSIPYIALSYCWGGKDPAKTLRSNYHARTRGMSITTLPRTYRQAIYLARQLGIRHLWIDALCIVQDDDEDWQRESSRLAETYSGAEIVFVAAAAADVEGGLNPPTDFPDWRHLTEGQIEVGPIWVRAKDHWRDACEMLPISARAWTYQERLLARRCLIFGESEVVWECMQGCRCVCSAAHTVACQSEPHLLPWLPSAGTPERHFASSQDAYEFWSYAVLKFSRMQLTRPTDRLPAISAIASVVQAETGDQYLAGLWRRGLLMQLAWRPFGSGAMDPPYDVYVAPSWSWASFPSNVNIPAAGQPEELCAEAAEILHVRSKPVNLFSPLGAVHHGTLTLRGLCMWANIQLAHKYAKVSIDKIPITGTDLEYPVRLKLDYYRETGDPIRDPPRKPDKAHAMPRSRAEKREVQQTPVQLLYLTGNIFLVLSKSSREQGARIRVGTLSLNEDLVDFDENYVRVFHVDKDQVRNHLLSAASREEVVVV